MRKNEIEVGGRYLAKVSGKLVTVRVNRIRLIPADGGFYKTAQTRYYVTNLKTGREVIFKSARRFRGPAVIPS